MQSARVCVENRKRKTDEPHETSARKTEKERGRGKEGKRNDQVEQQRTHQHTNMPHVPHKQQNRQRRFRS